MLYWINIREFNRVSKYNIQGVTIVTQNTHITVIIIRLYDIIEE